MKHSILERILMPVLAVCFLVVQFSAYADIGTNEVEAVSFSESESGNGAVMSGKGAAIINQFREGLHSNWKKLSRHCVDTIDMHVKRDAIHSDGYWDKRSKRKYGERIKSQLEQIRELLLTTDARKLLLDVESYDANIKEVSSKIQELTGNPFLGQREQRKIDDKIAKLEVKQRELEEGRSEAAYRIRAELDAIGLRLSGDSAEKCIFPIDINDLIDASIVAKHVGLVVDELGRLMKLSGGDINAAKRYYGMYVVMLEVQKQCFDDFVWNSKSGPWRRKLAELRKKGIEQRANTYAELGKVSYNDLQKATLLKNANALETMLRAVDLYEETLDNHQKIIAKKADEVAKMLVVARNSLTTVTLVGDFISLIQTAEDTFDALSQLELPPLESFDDAALQEAFISITDKLK